jgi:glycosyltransferase involved in cell wall biosynthesis
MATVRVFLPTYRRPALLERAVASLRAQTFTDWVGELHNDAPDDERPARLLAELNDPRLSYHPHPRNLGGTATFNLFFRATPEPFYAMLEDDNAWEPHFLATMLGVAERHPDVTVFWTNQSIWQEEEPGSVRDLHRTVHPATATEPPRRVDWGQPAQICGALHSHGSALLRSRPGDDFSTPLIPISLVEAFRERLFPYPLVFVPQPLARFTVTRTTARSTDHAEWAELQMMLAATFLKYAPFTREEIARLYADFRSRRPPTTSALLFAGLTDPACRPLLRAAHPIDWLRLLRGALRRPGVPGRLLQSRRRHSDWWSFLDRHTAARFSAQRGTQCPPWGNPL